MTSARSTIRVVIVDDSALARRSILEALSSDRGIEVVGMAADAYAAREMILSLEPDVITLDLQMPLMDGLTFLRILQEHHPLPVIVVSSLTPAGSELAMSALAAGAVDVLQKPDGSQPPAVMARRLCAQVRAAHLARRSGNRPPAPLPVVPPAWGGAADGRRVILVGASTGGVEALRFLLPRLPAGLPPILVVQHIPANFSRVMAEHIDRLAPCTVREAVDGERLHAGLCLVAPGDFHMMLQRQGDGYRVRLSQSPPVNHCRPSVDVLFRSAAEQAGRHAVAVILTGMGSDGARGMQLLRAAGARTLAEAEESCVVYGMPQAAVKAGGVERSVPLERMPRALLEILGAEAGA
ncbi:MAG: chemotaxis response regulator protein-glutamate methylesterase [Gammaproteobacteria bacterium]